MPFSLQRYLHTHFLARVKVSWLLDLDSLLLVLRVSEQVPDELMAEATRAAKAAMEDSDM